METSSTRKAVSRLLHWIGEISSRASAAGVVTLGVLVFVVVLSVEGFSWTWESAFSFVASAITLIMVFVIQHTQSRQQVATQLKLDELIRSTPKADDLLIHIESAEDEELIALDQDAIDQHAAIRDEQGPAGGEPLPGSA